MSGCGRAPGWMNRRNRGCSEALAGSPTPTGSERRESVTEEKGAGPRPSRARAGRLPGVRESARRKKGTRAGRDRPARGRTRPGGHEPGPRFCDAVRRGRGQGNEFVVAHLLQGPSPPPASQHASSKNRTGRTRSSNLVGEIGQPSWKLYRLDRTRISTHSRGREGRPPRTGGRLGGRPR